MADSPDSAPSILGTPDPTAIPPNLAAVPPSGDQPTALPPTIAAPAAGSDMPTPMGSSPGTEVPPDPDAERQVHEAWWRRALDKVGSILGGDQTVHITKDADGNVTMTHDPSTTGEKWGRIAQAALVGAASGIQNSQGPGGLARAGAAGVQTGAQLPQQREQQAQQQVDFDNKQMMEKAQRMFVTQKGLELAAQAKRENLQHAQESAQALNDNYDLIDQSPNSENLGSIDLSDPMAIPNAAKKSPAAYDAYLHKGNKRFRYAVGPDNNINLFLTDRNWEEQMNDIPTKVSDVDTNDAGKPVLKSKIVPPNTGRNGKLYTHSTAARNTYFSQLKTWSDAENADSKANKDDAKTLDTSGKTLDAWRKETDQTKKAGLWTQYQQQLKDEKALKEKPPAEGTWVAGQDKAGNTIFYNNKNPNHVIEAPENFNKLGTKEKQDAAIDKATKPAREAMGYANTYMSQGTADRKAFTGPGDEALMDKYFELAKPSSGFRMTPGQQKMLIDSRGWMGSLEGRAYHKINGTWFNPQQRQQIVATMGNLAVSKGITPGGGGETGGDGAGGGRQGPVTAGQSFQAMTPPANEPQQQGKFYGKGPKGVGWYR